MLRKLLYASAIALIAGIFGSELFAGTREDSFTRILDFLVLISVAVLAIVSFGVCFQQRKTGGGGLLLALVGLSWIVFSLAGCPRGVVAHATAPDGTKMCIIETPGGETHQTGFYYQKPGKRWGWFYYEHEDSHWWFGHVRLTNNGSHAIIYRFVLPVAEFDIPTESFTILRWGRTIRSAQQWMPDTWKPEDAVNLPIVPKSPVQGGPPTDATPKSIEDLEKELPFSNDK